MELKKGWSKESCENLRAGLAYMNVLMYHLGVMQPRATIGLRLKTFIWELPQWSFARSFVFVYFSITRCGSILGQIIIVAERNSSRVCLPPRISGALLDCRPITLTAFQKGANPTSPVCNLQFFLQNHWRPTLVKECRVLKAGRDRLLRNWEFKMLESDVGLTSFSTSWCMTYRAEVWNSGVLSPPTWNIQQLIIWCSYWPL